jgi:hypothetical protein
MDNTNLFEDFHFLLFKISEEEINTESRYNFISPSDKDTILNDMPRYINLYFYNIIFNIPFDTKWNDIIKIIKTYHQIKNYNLVIPELMSNLEKYKLNKFIIRFIKDNFILKKNNNDITNIIDLWSTADQIIPNKIFFHSRPLFNAYNIDYKYTNTFPTIQFKDTFINFLNIFFFENIFRYNIEQDILEQLYNKYESTINTSIQLQTKIDMMKKIIDDNIKTKKEISFTDMADLIQQNNINKKKFLKEKQSILDGLLFIINKKKDDDF